MKTCGRCGKTKHDSEFNKDKKTKSGLAVYCRSCEKQYRIDNKEYLNLYDRKRYKRRKQQIINNTNKRRDRNREFMDSLKQSNNTCIDCGLDFPFYKLEFDHLEAAGKVFNLGDLSSKACSIETILDEVVKCEIVCCNCHKKRGHIRAKLLYNHNKARKIINIIKDAPCGDCGDKIEWYQMEFDHIGPKTNTICNMVNRCEDIEIILLEISQCELVCGNCHKERTYLRRMSVLCA